MHDAALTQPLQINQLLICLQGRKGGLSGHVQIATRAWHVGVAAMADTVSATIEIAVTLRPIRPKCHIFGLVRATEQDPLLNYKV